MACCCNSGVSDGNFTSRDLMLVQVNRVFNGARIRGSVANETFTLSNFSSAYTPPLTYVRAFGEGDATVLSQLVTPLLDGRSRVRITYSCPITVFMLDAANIEVTASATIVRSLDIIIRVPIRPHTFEVVFEFRSRIGTVNDNQTVTLSGCILTVVKVLVKCEILIRPCGCVIYPDAVLTEEIVCQGLFSGNI